MPDSAQFDLDTYLHRIGWQGERRPDAATLRGVHLAHTRSLPFENLDALGGIAPSLAPADLTAKLLNSRRGGYCYEHNTLLAHALEALGFRVTRLTARVLVGTDRPESRPRTHMALLVEAPDDPQPYLADVGFGALGALLEAVPLTTGTEFHDAGRRHRLVHAPQRGPLPMWVLEAHRPEKPAQDGAAPAEGTDDAWEAQYAFTVEPFEQRDFEVINWYIATHPRSPFSRRAYAHRLTGDTHLLLDDRLLTETRADGTVTERELADEDEVRRVLDEKFGITVPPGLTLLGRP
ncbi:arylamine N-acetyltransferase [Streptomyces sp. Ru71]|uniref:arylamine N-acetyltransferase family protein n=1 Tax=Streptomyces sp. Ru71 TaxID=2080746 RepID=UPI000CDD05B3|nr:arylamine N-acetyltransferase [Streptomyces sp. Ru71]POX47410.1 arylamine N-acetyltransferase [Streptomyces sp. Ru71]